MSDWFVGLNGLDQFFLICAVIGGIFVALRIVFLFMGFSGDLHTDIDMGGHDIDLHHSDSDYGFKVLSIQGLSSFLMMFGLVGLALHSDSKMGMLVSLGGALISGCAAIWLIGKLFSVFIRLQSSGTISIEDTLGAQGSVYMTIPENGTGRVLVKVRNSLREFDATSLERLETGVPIRVLGVDGNVLLVERI